MFRRDLWVGWFCLFLLFAVSGAANARLMQWDLHNVVFDDGGTATGYFGWDLAEARIVFDMQTSGGDFPPTHYTRGTADFFTRFGTNIFSCSPFEPTNEKQCLQFTVFNGVDNLTGDLPENGGIVPVFDCPRTPPTICASLTEFLDRGSPFRRAISGELIGHPVPEASTAGFLIAGLFAAIGMRFRRRHGGRIADFVSLVRPRAQARIPCAWACSSGSLFK